MLEGLQITGYHIIFSLAVMIIIGHGFGKLAEKIHLPEVTGYIISGILLNLLFTKVLKYEHEFTHVIHTLEVVSVIALGFLSYTLGTKLWWPKLKMRFKTIMTTVLVETVLIVSITTLLFSLIGLDLWVSLLIGGISVATASAPVLEITKKYQAKGPLTDTLISGLGLDNVIGISVFLMIVPFAAAIKGQNTVQFQEILTALLSILISVGVGALAGLALVFIDRKVLCRYYDEEKYESYLIMTVAIVLITTLVAPIVTNELTSNIIISPFIASLILGAVYTNFVTKETFKYELGVINNFTPPLITAFFVIAGAELDVSKLPEFGLYAIIYVLAHVIGKLLGAYFGSRIDKNTPEAVKKFLPTASLTQGGFEIFLAASVGTLFFVVNDPAAVEQAQLIKNIVLTSVLIFEFFAPMLLIKSLKKAGEATDHIKIHCEPVE